MISTIVGDYMKINYASILKLSDKISEVTLRTTHGRYWVGKVSFIVYFKGQYDTRRKPESFLTINHDGMELHYISTYVANDCGIDIMDQYPRHLLIDGVDFV